MNCADSTDNISSAGRSWKYLKLIKLNPLKWSKARIMFVARNMNRPKVTKARIIVGINLLKEI